MVARLCVAIVVAGSVIVACAEDKPVRQMTLSIKVYEKTAGAKQIRVLGEPSIVAAVGRPFSVVSGGGVIKSKTGDDDLRFGTHAGGIINATGDGAFRLAVKFELGSIVPVKDEPETNIVKTDSLDIRTVLRSKETKNFKISDSRWCEIYLEPADWSAWSIPLSKTEP